MTDSTHTDEVAQERTNWNVEYPEADPIELLDPVAEALTVLEPGDPLVVTYEDVVKIAGHSCPTASGAFRIAQVGLDALYPDSLPVRGDIEVLTGGPKDDPVYGVMSRLVSYITGAAGIEGFGGLGGGYGGRDDDLYYGDIESDSPAFVFRRKDTGDAVEVVYHVGEVPSSGPATQNLPKLIEGTATDEERAAFREAWHGPVRTVLTDDSLFTVEETDREF